MARESSEIKDSGKYDSWWLELFWNCSLVYGIYAALLYELIKNETLS